MKEIIDFSDLLEVVDNELLSEMVGFKVSDIILSGKNVIVKSEDEQ